jgi:hypothetical protein
MTPRVTPRPNGGAVPFLPGHVVHDVTKQHHPLSQTLVYSLDSAADKLKPDSFRGPKPGVVTAEHLAAMAHPAYRLDMSTAVVTHEERASAKESARNTTTPRAPPAWLKHDRQVLRFNAFFQEPVHENPNENFRIRNCIIYFYLEDGTMQIIEPKNENSGIPQGAFLKRHRYPKADGTGFYGPADLKCGGNISVYAKTFRITNGDDFTKWFYENSFLDFGHPEDTPSDTYSEGITQKKMIDTKQTGGVTRDVVEGREYTELMLGGNRKNAKLQQYLANDRKVLRFQCFWDDHTRYGTRQYFVLHFFLADDTVEILECYARNAGRDPYPVFYKRSPLRKNPIISPTPGILEPEPVIYKPHDLIVGEAIDIFGRKIVVYDCDEFTRSFYKDYLGHEQPSLPIDQPEQVHIQLSHAPHIGIGSEEDSLASCMALRPKPPRKDLLKLMTNSDRVLRFEAKMGNGLPEDKARTFVIGVFLADDTVGVWEPRKRNSGHTEGKWAERSKKRNPATGDWFKPVDFFVGAGVEINGCPFVIAKADEYTLKYMEQNPEVFGKAGIAEVAAKISGLKAVPEFTGMIKPDDLRALAQAKLGYTLADQELIAILRACAAPGTSDIATSELAKYF